MILPVDQNLNVSAGLDINICTDETAQLNGYASNQTSLEWTTAGDGTFNDATIMNAVYTPGAQDIANGGTTLTLTAHKGSEVLSDDLELSFVEEPVVSGETEYIKLDTEAFEISLDIENLGNFTGWTTTGTGNFANPYALQTVYTPSDADYDATDIILTASYTGCGYKTYEQAVNVHFSQDGVITPAEAKLSIHPNPTNDVINVSIDNVSSDVQIMVYNSVGQMVYMQNETVENGLFTTIDLNNLSSGTYILQVRSDVNVWTKKVIKK